jgi:hypothetical protein
MTDRIYRTILGLVLLMVLYFESTPALYGLVVVLLLEGVSHRSIPRLVGELGTRMGMQALAYHPEPCKTQPKYNFDAELMWRLTVAVIVLITYSFDKYFWFFPWFMGFAIFGSGLSGVCPGLLALRWLGFK